MSRTVPNTDAEIGCADGTHNLLRSYPSMSNEDITDENTVGTNADESNDETLDLEAELEDDYEAEQKKKEMMQRKIDDAKIEGWAVASREGDRTVMRKADYGSLGMHIIIFILTVWFSLGLCNVAYAGWRYAKHSDKKVVRV